MKAVLTRLTEGLNDLRRFIGLLNIEANLLALEVGADEESEPASLIRSYQAEAESTANKRRFDYTTVIISLYGFWEQFVEDLIRSYISALASWAHRYDQLPERVVAQHLDGSVRHLVRIQDGRSREVVAAASVIHLLHECLNSGSSSRLNTEAFTYHTANIRREQVDQLCNGIGVLNASQSVRAATTVQPYLRRRFPDRIPGAIAVADLWAPIDELAERRNEAAHGVAGDLLSNDLLLELLETVEYISRGLAEVIRHASLPAEAAAAVALGSPVAVFHQRVCGVRLEHGDIKVGDRILIRTRSKHRPFKEAEVLELQVNRVPHERVAAAEPINVGVRLSNTVAASNDLFLIPVGRSVLRERGITETSI